ncbi:hypothetical protein OV015_25725, partial [Salmonella enterica subsp. enterica serovar 1,4,[5],12:i:-]|nr:hypothetical protein [Salmonella enterica subsp. enterica serovar 1,4,[5],12:i:-]
MPKSQLLFSAVFGFRNPSKEIFSELDEINAQGPIFTRSFQKTKSHDTENLPETPPPPIPSRGIQEIASGTL